MALWPLLAILGMVFLSMFYPGVESGDGLIDDLRVRPLFAIITLLGIALGAVSFPMSLAAVFKKGERSILVFLATILGLFLTLLLLGEIFFQH